MNIQCRLARKPNFLLVATLSALALAGCGEGGSSNVKEKSGGVFAEKTVEKEGIFYYRIIASYKVKETGEPLDFDFVVACGASVTHWRYTGPSTRVSTHPLAMVKPTSNGGAVLMRTYRPLCEMGRLRWSPYNGDTNGAPFDLLPFVIWFDDVNDLSFGWGYATEDAYHNANSKLEFVIAYVKASNAKEWRAWREKAEADYEQIGQLPGPWGYSYTNGPKEHSEFVKSLSATGEDITNSCSGYVRYSAPKEVIEKIWSSAPAHNPAPVEGRYFPIFGKQDWLKQILRDAGPVFGDQKRDYRDYQSHNLGQGAINRNNGGFIRTGDTRRKAIADHFPILPRSKSTDVPITEPADVYPRRILVGDAWKGMTACGGDYRVPGPDHLYEALRVSVHGSTFDPETSFDVGWQSKQFPLYVNDEIAVENLRDQPVGGLTQHLFIIDREGYILDRRPWGYGGL